jgi:hypothetical protein
MTTKTYIRFYLGGRFFPEFEIREVAARTQPTELPARAYGYDFYDQSEFEEDGEMLTGRPKNESAMYYVGEFFTKKQMKEDFTGDEYRILVSNIDSPYYIGAVRTIRGNWQPVRPEDTVLPAKQFA